MKWSLVLLLFFSFITICALNYHSVPKIISEENTADNYCVGDTISSLDHTIQPVPNSDVEKIPRKVLKPTGLIQVHLDMNRINFIDSINGDVIKSIYIKEISPYFKTFIEPIPAKYNISGNEEMHTYGAGLYSIADMDKESVIQEFGLKNLRAPIPEGFEFGKCLIHMMHYLKYNTLVLKFSVQFISKPEINGTSTCYLSMAEKQSLVAYNNLGELIWEARDLLDPINPVLSHDGRFLLMQYGSIDEDYCGPMTWEFGFKFIDIFNNKEILHEPFLTNWGFGEAGGSFGSVYENLDGTITYFISIIPSQQITYLLPIETVLFKKQSFNNTGYENGMEYFGRFYSYEQDYIKIPFSESLYKFFDK